MSALEHRMQLLLDEERVAKLRRRAEETGMSVSAVVRAAIDASFEDDDMARRAQAARDFLALTADNARHEAAEPADLKRAVHDAMDAELIAKLERL